MFDNSQQNQEQSAEQNQEQSAEQNQQPFEDFVNGTPAQTPTESIISSIIRKVHQTIINGQKQSTEKKQEPVSNDLSQQSSPLPDQSSSLNPTESTATIIGDNNPIIEETQKDDMTRKRDVFDSLDTTDDESACSDLGAEELEVEKNPSKSFKYD